MTLFILNYFEILLLTLFDYYGLFLILWLTCNFENDEHISSSRIDFLALLGNILAAKKVLYPESVLRLSCSTLNSLGRPFYVLHVYIDKNAFNAGEKIVIFLVVDNCKDIPKFVFI